MKTKKPGDDFKCVRQTLAWCNRWRATKRMKLLKKLPKGSKRDPESCPCGRATGLYVDVISYAENRWDFTHERRNPLPLAVRRFVQLFDQGAFPSLVAEKKS